MGGGGWGGGGEEDGEEEGFERHNRLSRQFENKRRLGLRWAAGE